MSPRRVAIVGAGPAGMYAVEHLLERRDLDVKIDLFERLASPWGLVRGGVAPDHQEKKLVADRLFDYYFHSPKLRFFGNVEVGRDVTTEELTQWYDAVVYAVGAASDTRLGVPGEDLNGSSSAREFVAWYNGHPDASHLTFDLSGDKAVVVGNGNVALDVARILAAPIDLLERTDIADHAMAALRESRIEEVVVMGRRGHLQSAFHNPELEEFHGLGDVEIVVEGVDLSDLPDDVHRDVRRKVETFRALTSRRISEPRKRIRFCYLVSPVEILGAEHVEGLRVRRNELKDGRIEATEDESEIKTSLVLRSIGYKGKAIPGLPFDEHGGVVPNDLGRVQGLEQTYVTGWIKRGPKGIIGTNKKCARDTVHSILQDWQGTGADGALDVEEVGAILSARDVSPVDRADWVRIDHEEKIRGLAQNRPRVKMTEIGDMLASLGR